MNRKQLVTLLMITMLVVSIYGIIYGQKNNQTQQTQQAQKTVKLVLTEQETNDVIVALQSSDGISANTSTKLINKIVYQYNDSTLNPRLKDTIKK